MFFLSSQEIILAEAVRLKMAFDRPVAMGFLRDPSTTLKDPIRLEFERVPPAKGEKD